ncbi:ADP-heptose:LPS heptosyltransferase [Pantoea allii]|uniref:ADP-heptose:LPS heptosyltransferase n=1 Tax=Pantoea allii TaxID=574096 RepID=A0A2V2BMM3_9GAMM|nr:glycosyltransferase family 9 protein [Pantoea allii]PWK97487.1 ADP-heptose:LPS heptosyltransferase [Pantoea allii]
MSKNLEITIRNGRFKKLRQWNRRKNYYIKQLKIDTKVYIAKLIWDKYKKESFDVTLVKTVLLLRNEGTVGDVVVTTPLIKCLYEAGYTVDLLLTKKSSLAVKYNPYVKDVYEANDCSNAVFLKDFNHTVPDSTIQLMKKKNYDLVVDLCLFETPVHRMKLFHDIKPKNILGFNKWNCINHYSKSISFKNDKEHVTKAISMVADKMKLGFIDSRAYDLHIPDFILSEINNFFNTSEGDSKIIINAFTGSPERNLSQDQLAKTLDMLKKMSNDIKIIILDHKNEINIPLPENVVINPFSSLHHVMALIREADMIISPDTAIVHISAAWKKPLISVYKNVGDNNDLWGPGYKNASQIIINNRKLSDVDIVPNLIIDEIKKRGLIPC